MTGHVRQRGKNSFELKFDIGPDPKTGKRRIRYKNVKGTKREANIELSRLVSEHAAGDSVDPSKTTVAQYLGRWEQDWAKVNVAGKTFERYSELLRKHVCPHIGNTAIQKLRAVNLNELYASLSRDGQGARGGLAPRTIGHVHRVLHRALGHAVQWGVVRQNVAAQVSPPRVASTEIKILSAAQVQTVLKKLQGRAIYPMGLTALGTGMRRGELLALRWKDIDFDRALLRVERSVEQTNQGIKFKSPKTRHGRRTITLPASLVIELKAHWKRQQEQRLKIGLGKAPPDALVFATWEGKVRSPDGLTKEWSLAMKAAGLPDVTLHSLRHTHASHLIASGLDVLQISRRLGHGSPTITLTVYGHLFSNTDDRAAQIMEETFAKAEAET